MGRIEKDVLTPWILKKEKLDALPFLNKIVKWINKEIPY
jgi:hypothetical protein